MRMMRVVLSQQHHMKTIDSLPVTTTFSDKTLDFILYARTKTPLPAQDPKESACKLLVYGTYRYQGISIRKQSHPTH
jgi:hypothetical protein